MDTCMGPADLGEDKLTDDELTDDVEEETRRPVATLAELDPRQFTQLLADKCSLEEGEIPTARSSQFGFHPYIRPPLLAQQADRTTKRNVRGIINETFRQIQEARKSENTSGCFHLK